MTRSTGLAVALAAALALALPAHAQGIRSERVQFDAGTSGTVISEELVGDEIVDYVLGVSAGQRMVIDMTTSNASAHFNLTGPEASAATFVGSTEGLHFDGVLPTGGDWTIRVYLMRNAARRGESADIALSVHVGGAAAPTVPAADFADGEAGGPDYWEVTAGSLNVRSSPSTTAAVVGRASGGDVLRNLGCQGAGNDRWCRVESANRLLSGWVASVYLTESGGPAAIPQAPAETEAMGPDYWEVANVAADDMLNLRAGPGTSNSIVARAPNGAILRNLGCRGLSDARWCHVQTPDGGIDGWAAGGYLRESGGPVASGPGITLPGSGDLAPELHLRSTGEIEARWPSGCTILYSPAAERITAGASCDATQLDASDRRIAQFR